MPAPLRTAFRIACVQASPVFLNLEATLDKACRLIEEAGAAGARLVVFPECYLPTYPVWVWFIPPYRTKDLRTLYTELVRNAVTIPDGTTDRLCTAAREAGVHVAIGVNEVNAEASGTTLYNSILFIDDEGRILGKHRKLVPTTGERLVHGMGDGSTLAVYDTPIGRLGGLTCWEMYMPLAKYAMYTWGVEILVVPTWDRGEPWISTLRHTAKEGRTYVVGCCSTLHRDDIPDHFSFKSDFLPDVEWLNPGDSTIIDPDGKFIVEPVRHREEILYADIEPDHFIGPRFQLDAAGHYARPDLFDLTLNRTPRPMMRVIEEHTTEPSITEALHPAPEEA